MRKWLVRVGICVIAAVAAVTAMRFAVSCRPAKDVEKILAAHRKTARHGGLTITSPLDETLFPPEIVPPVFRWKEQGSDADTWLVTVDFSDGQPPLNVLRSVAEWTPSDEQWKVIRSRSLEKTAKVTVLGVRGATCDKILSEGSVSIRTSKDEVGAAIFYREVNLPFADAVKDPTRIRWRFGEISSREQPAIVLENLPVCGNCHSFSRDGKVLGMDVDYANDRGSYALVPVSPEMVLDKQKIITWADYKREDGRLTLGMLSQVSPDGRYVVSTVKDRSVFVAKEDLAFSQLFFPIRGILAIYDRSAKRFQALPGADEEPFVQSNPAWSPDGKYIVFAKSKAYRLKYARGDDDESVLLMPDECREFLEGQQGFQFDLYRIPFNEGQGGRAEPLAGASQNGMSNYFPKFSPDGKWIVFCKAKNFMLLQPDSQLWIVPASGGEARRLECNTARMNSWHSWSPNGKWMVFSSKASSPYTQLFLTHIDDQGHSSPAVLLSHFTQPDRAANIPEFVALRDGAIQRIRQQFVDDASYLRAGQTHARHGRHQLAVEAFQKALEINPDNKGAHPALGVSLSHLGKLEEAREHFLKAIQIRPENTYAYCNLGNVLVRLKRPKEAQECYRQALQVDPKLALAHLQLGTLLLEQGSREDAKAHLSEAVRLVPGDVLARYNLASAWLQEGNLREAASHYRQILDQQPNHLPSLLSLATIRATSGDATVRNGKEAVELAERGCELTRYRDPQVLDVLGMAYAEAGRFPDAVMVAQAALRMVRAAGDEEFAKGVEGRLRLYQRKQPFRRSSDAH